MASDRLQRQKERLLDEADQAITKEDWSTLASRARAVLGKDLKSSDTPSFLIAAGRALCSLAFSQTSHSGRFLHAPNRGHHSIACFSVDTSTGQLTATGRVASEAIPNALCLDPQDKFLFSAGQESGRMASFSVNPDSGELTPLETYPLGDRPGWVSITELPG